MSNQFQTVVTGGIKVRVIAESSDVYLQGYLASNNNFEPVVAVAKELLAKDAVILDIGASIGITSIALSQIATEGTVFAVEANANLIPNLERTAQSTSGCMIEVIHAAIGAKTGSLLFHEDLSGGAWGFVTEKELSIPATATINPVVVPQITIDSLVAGKDLDRLDLIKMDVEGFELNALEGALSTIEKFDPFVLFELNPFCLWRYGRTFPQDLMKFSQAHWSHLYSILSNGDCSRLDSDSKVAELLGFLGTTGGNADILCSSSPLQIPSNLGLDLTQTVSPTMRNDAESRHPRWKRMLPRLKPRLMV